MLPNISNKLNSNTFGSLKNGRNFSMGSGYRFGFNGKEKDKDEEGMGGGGSTYDYGFRIYNPNLGKFLSVDPLTSSYPWYTPYQFAGNRPIDCIDLDGLEEFKVTSWKNNSLSKWQSKISLIKLDGPLTVTYYTRTWKDAVVPKEPLLAKEGFVDNLIGTTTAANPFKTEREESSANDMLKFNKSPGQKIGDNKHDNNIITELSDPTIIPMPIESKIKFEGNNAKIENTITSKKEIKDVAADFIKNGEGQMTILGNVASGGAMEEPGTKGSIKNGFKTKGDLAIARAKTLKNEFIKQGISADKIIIKKGNTSSMTASYSYKKKK